MSLDDKANMVKDMIESEINRYKDVVFNSLLNTTYLNSIPESLFVNYFLPCFLGHSNNSNWVMEWISIAGSPMAEVGVFKDGTNEILFSVPSILNSNNLLLNKTDGNFDDIFKRYEQINNNIPMQGLNFLLEALNSKNSELVNKINFNDVNNKWIAILTRYGLIANENNDTNTKDTSLDNALDF